MKKISLIAILVLSISCRIQTKGQDGKSGEPGQKGSNEKKGQDGQDGEDGKSVVIGLDLGKKNKPKDLKDGILIGKAKINDLQQSPYSDWFSSGYNEYQPNSETISQIRPYVSDYKITIFMGTWCGDSQDQVPKFYKILKELNFPNEKVTLIAMTREKATPELFEKNLNITHVPTFIFSKNGEEINRIVESPVESLEQDILNIVSKQPYKHTYAE